MQKKFDALKMALINGRASRKNFILTVVALVEIIMIMVVSTFAWVETTSSLEIKGTGNIDTITYNIANIGSSESYANKSINLSDYFRNAGNVHLSPASSADGTNIYFPVAGRSGDTSNTYRKGNVDDKNVNYISFAFDLKAATSDSDFYFAKTPVIKVDGEEVNTNDIRIAITALGKTTIYSNTENTTEEVVSSVEGTKSDTSVEAFSKHVNSDSAPDNTELFEVKSGATERIIISLWLQKTDQNADQLSAYAGKTVTVEDFELVVGATKVSFVDATTDFNGTLTGLNEFNGWHWVDNKIDNQYPQLLIFDGKKSYLMTKDADFETNHKWVGRVPQALLSDSSKTMYFCRCKNGTTSISNLNDAVVYNYWTAKISDAMEASSVKYTAYGATQSGGKIGYGTWGEVINIQLDTKATDILPKPTVLASATKITVTNTSNANIVCKMNYHDDVWSGFVPVENSESFKFSFTSSSSYYEITAANRYLDEIISKFVVTSATTGYWDPPATVEIHSNNDSYGTVSVSGGAGGVSNVMVTQGAEVTLKAEPNPGYKLVGIYSDSSHTNKLESYKVTAPNKGEKADYYALFEKITFDVKAYAYTGGSNVDTGGKVTVSTSTASGDTGSSSSLTVDYGTEVKFTAAVASGYKFDGWYDAATEGTRISTSKEYTETITSTDNHTTLYARFIKSNSTTTIYIEPRANYGDSYYLWAFNASTGTGYTGTTWQCDDSQATFDTTTGYYKYTFTTEDTGDFYAYISSKSSDTEQYPADGENSVKGTIGYTYLFKTGLGGLEDYTEGNVCITFKDGTDRSWANNSLPNMVLKDTSNNNNYNMTFVDDSTWFTTVPSTVTTITFARMNPENSNDQWKYWNTTRTSSNFIYTATGTDSNNGSWTK